MVRIVCVVIAFVLSNLACTDHDTRDGKLITGTTVELESAFSLTPMQIEASQEEMGACCTFPNRRGGDTLCTETSRDNCDRKNGNFAAGQECGQDSCTFGSCCADRICDLFSGQCCENPPNETCDLLRPFIGCLTLRKAYCASIDGEFGGTGSSCSTAECIVPNGACCVDDGVSPPGCVDNDALTCLQMGGEYSGDGTNCVDNQCVFDEACCFPSGVCDELKPSLCLTEGGAPGGMGSRCAGFPQGGNVLGACCRPNPQAPGGFVCSETNANSCSNLGGDFRGVGTSCDCAVCSDDVDRACCFPSGTCHDLSVEGCISEGGDSQAFGRVCATWQCSRPPGACCIPDAQQPGIFSCQEIRASQCLGLGGEYLGINTSCEAADCGADVVQACCTVVGNCFDLTPEVCSREGGVSAGAGTLCDDFQCGQ